MFVNLHNHSSYSLFDGFQSIEEMVARAKALGQKALGLCDHGTTSGLYHFRKVCSENGIHPVMGVELYFTTYNIKDKQDIYHIGVWAQTTKGLHNLYKLTTLAHQNFYSKPRLTFEMIQQYNEGIVITSACCGGFLSHPDGFQWAQKFQSLLGDRFYIELFATDDEKVSEYNQLALSIAKSLDVKTILSVDAHYAEPSKREIHKKWKECGDDNYFSGSTYYLMSEDDAREYAVDSIGAEIVRDSIANTHELAMSCSVEIDTKTKHYPTLGIANPKEELLKRCREGFVTRKLTTLSKEDKAIYGERVKYEIDIFERAGYLDYLLITIDILDNARRNNILCGAGRGSVVASLVAYLTGITHVDPIKYNLVFERFCHLERVTPPDIDNDLESLRREDVIHYIRERFGEVYQVRTINTLGIKGAIQRAGQVLGKDPKIIDEYSKLFGENIEKLPDLDVKKFAEHFNGYIQNYGVHASAIVVMPSDPCEWCAIERQGDKTNKKETYVAAYDFHELEEMGILKIDILGLKTLDIIHDTLKSIGKDLDIYHLEDDKNVFDMLSQGKTLGCFQVSSKGMTNTIKEMKPRTVSDLFDLVALYRPGIMDANMLEPYLQHTAELLHPSVEDILRPTRNIIVYQEQVLEIVRRVAGYTLGEADMVRRVMGRKEIELVKAAGEEFIKRAVANGYATEEANHIWDHIKTFARYGFNKGHAAAYGYTAYITAYLKYYHPKEFYAATLNFTEREEVSDYTIEMMKNGIQILKPRLDHYKWTATEEGVIVGLKAIKGFGEQQLLPIDKRDEIWYNINRRSVEALIKAGVWDGDRNLMLAQLEWYKDKRKRKPALETVTAKTNITETAMEYDVLGFSFDSTYSAYDDNLCQRFKDCELGTVISFKPWKTKKGKPMAFVKVNMKGENKDLVCFDEGKCYGIKTGQTYVFRVEGSQITDYVEAKRK